MPVSGDKRHVAVIGSDMAIKDSQVNDIVGAINELQPAPGGPTMNMDAPGLSEAILVLSRSIEKLAAAFLDAKEDV